MTTGTGRLKQFGLTALLLGAMSISLAACGGDSATPTAAPQPTATVAAATGNTGTGTTSDVAADSAGTAQEVNITLKEWAIEPKEVTVQPGKIKFIVSNSGEFSHDIAFSLQGQEEVGRTEVFKASDGPQTLEVELQPGTYKMVCDIPGHESRGMVGTLTVK